MGPTLQLLRSAGFCDPLTVGEYDSKQLVSFVNVQNIKQPQMRANPGSGVISERRFISTLHPFIGDSVKMGVRYIFPIVVIFHKTPVSIPFP